MPQSGLAPFALVKLLIFVAGLLPGTIFLMWLYNTTGGKLLPVIVAHGSYNLFVNGVIVPKGIRADLCATHHWCRSSRCCVVGWSIRFDNRLSLSAGHGGRGGQVSETSRRSTVESTSEPLGAANHGRGRLGIREELTLALFPTATVLLVLGLVEVLSAQRLLFASLASSAFLIYLDPTHATNQARTLTFAQLSAAVLGWAIHMVLGPGYGAAGLAMVSVIVAMIAADAVHPPAVGTAMSFALRGEDASDLALFALAIGILCTLLILQRAALWLLVRLKRGRGGAG